MTHDEIPSELVELTIENNNQARLIRELAARLGEMLVLAEAGSEFKGKTCTMVIEESRTALNKVRS